VSAVQTQKRYWTQELSSPRPDLQIHAQTQKRYWTQELSNPRPDLQIRVKVKETQGSNPRSANQDLQKFLILSAWTQVPDSSKSAADGTERKDQIRVLQTKTASEPFTIRNILSEGSEVQSPLAPGRQTRALVINSKTASETASENQTGSYPVLMVLLQKDVF